MPRTLEALDEALICLEKAVEKSEINLNERLKGIDLTAFVTKQEFQEGFKDIDIDIRFLRESKSMIDGKATQQGLLYVLAISITALITSLIALILRFLKI